MNLRNSKLVIDFTQKNFRYKTKINNRLNRYLITTLILKSIESFVQN
jgi:hypothetical protein